MTLRQSHQREILSQALDPLLPKSKVFVLKIADSEVVHVIPTSQSNPLNSSDSACSSTDEFGSTESEDNDVIKSPQQSISDTGVDSVGSTESTVAETLFAPAKTTCFRVSDAASVTSVNFSEAPFRTPQLTCSSRTLITEYFDEAVPLGWPPGHRPIALNESQISQILKVVADEAVRSSLGSMANLFQQAIHLNLGT